MLTDSEAMTSSTASTSTVTIPLYTSSSASGDHGITGSGFNLPIGDREDIENRTQELIEVINSSRKRHSDFLKGFKEAINAQAERVYASVENNLFEFYESQSQAIDYKLQQLYATLKRISDLEKELGKFKKTLSDFNQELSK